MAIRENFRYTNAYGEIKKPVGVTTIRPWSDLSRETQKWIATTQMALTAFRLAKRNSAHTGKDIVIED